MVKRVIWLSLLLAAIAPRPALAADQWVEVAGPHFTLFTDAGEKQGRKILDQFERMRWVFQTLFPGTNVDPAMPIVVVAAKDEKTFATMEPAAYLGKGKMKLAGYFERSPEKNYILLQLDAEFDHPFATVYHEYTHAVFASSGELLPIWLNEGTAEFFQNTEINGKDVRLGQPSPDDILYLRQQRLIPLDVLFRVDRDSPYYHEEQKGSVFYSEAWAMTHYFMVNEREHHTHQLDDYVALIRNHEDPVAAAEKAFGDLKQLQKNLESYIGQASYTEFVLNSAAAPIDESAFKVEPVTEAEADAVRADVLQSVQRTDEARALLEAVLKADPNNALAHETMGQIELRAGHPEEARKWYGEAVELGSKNFLAYYYYAQFSMGQRDEGEVESSLRTAIQLNPRFPQSYDLLASYFAMKHENLDEAHRLNIQAIMLEPANIAFRVNAANVLMEAGRYDDALAVLQTAAKIARKPGDMALIQNRLDQLQQIRSAGAQGGVIVGEEQSESNGHTEVIGLAPSHPKIKTTGPSHSAEGVIRMVRCSAPHEIEFTLEMAAGHTLALYNNDFTTIDVTAAGFTPSGSIFPCTDFDGMKARVRYVESQDESVDGQVMAIELRK